MGVNFLPMADNALNSLDYWMTHIRLDKLRPYYSLILSKFDNYLQLNKTGNTDELHVHEKIFLLKQNYKGRGRKKLPVKLFEKNSADGSSDLHEQIQFRILKIIGQLAGEMGHCMYDSNATTAPDSSTEQQNQMITWDTVQHLSFAVPFVDIKPTIYFDRFLPRVVYLALSSTNRQTKVNACELLHAIVIFMIGKSVSLPEPLAHENSAFQMNKLYHNIYPALFR
jgi:DNA-dependent protein kinase catalytic subunit